MNIMIKLVFVVLVCGCVNGVESTTDVDDMTASPRTDVEEPAFDPDQPSDGAPVCGSQDRSITIQMPDGDVIDVPVPAARCVMWFDVGDPPPDDENVIDEFIPEEERSYHVSE